MGWYRTKSGRLIHATGSLAAVHTARGAVEVSERVALAEVASGEAQARADVEGELGAAVDARIKAEAEAEAELEPKPRKRAAAKKAAAK